MFLFAYLALRALFPLFFPLSFSLSLSLSLSFFLSVAVSLPFSRGHKGKARTLSYPRASELAFWYNCSLIAYTKLRVCVYKVTSHERHRKLPRSFTYTNLDAGYSCGLLDFFPVCHLEKLKVDLVGLTRESSGREKRIRREIYFEHHFPFCFCFVHAGSCDMQITLVFDTLIASLARNSRFTLIFIWNLEASAISACFIYKLRVILSSQKDLAAKRA